MSQANGVELESDPISFSSAESIECIRMPPISLHLGAVPGDQCQLSRPLATDRFDFTEDVVNFMRKYQFDIDNLVLFNDISLEKLVNSYESDETLAILLFNRL